MEINKKTLDRELVKHFNVKELFGSIVVSLVPSDEHGNSLAFHNHEDYLVNFENLLEGKPTVFRNSYGEIECNKDGIIIRRDNGVSQELSNPYVQDFIRANSEFYSDRSAA